MAYCNSVAGIGMGIMIVRGERGGELAQHQGFVVSVGGGIHDAGFPHAHQLGGFHVPDIGHSDGELSRDPGVEVDGLFQPLGVRDFLHKLMDPLEAF